MSKSITLSLKAGEKIYVNGAVIRVDRKVALEILNDATFLLEGHVIQPEECTTPLRQLYFVVQTMLMEPGRSLELRHLFGDLYLSTIDAFASEAIVSGLLNVEALVEGERAFEALRVLRNLFPLEDAAALGPAASKAA